MAALCWPCLGKFFIRERLEKDSSTIRFRSSVEDFVIQLLSLFNSSTHCSSVRLLSVGQMVMPLSVDTRSGPYEMRASALVRWAKCIALATLASTLALSLSVGSLGCIIR